MNKILINLETGEEQIIHLTSEELAQVALQQENNASAEKEQQSINIAKDLAKESAIAKLTALGLTEIEITAIVGGSNG